MFCFITNLDKYMPFFFVLPQTGHASYHGPTTLSVTRTVAGPRVWNSLPADLRLEMQFRAFRRQLKTVLFSR